MTLTYRDAGVDIDAGDELVERIKPLAKKTRTPHVLADVGGFAGLCQLPPGMKNPVLVSGTDGVGTKLKLAFALNRHDTVGIDLVAMCVNDIVTTGATPLFFLDYYATGKLNVDEGESVIRGIAEGCLQAGCALLGGETAELPGFYAASEYDLAGFAVGVVERDEMLTPKRVAIGDVLVGVSSTGLHSNGYSLARRVFGDTAAALRPQDAALGEPLSEALLRPTKIYAKTMRSVLAEPGVHAASHITGGGLPGNVPRVLPEGMGAKIDSRAWTRPQIFTELARRGDVPEGEMWRTFNMGVGLVIVVDKNAADAVCARATEDGCTATVIGEVCANADSDDWARVKIS